MRMVELRRELHDDPTRKETVYTQQPYTVVIVSARGHTAVGVSKVCYPDTFDPYTGWYIASGRAELALAEKIHSVRDAQPSTYTEIARFSTPTKGFGVDSVVKAIKALPWEGAIDEQRKEFYKEAIRRYENLFTHNAERGALIDAALTSYWDRIRAKIV